MRLLRNTWLRGPGQQRKRYEQYSEAPGGDIARLLAIRAMDEHGMLRENFDIRRPIKLEITYEVVKDGFAMIPHLGIVNEDGTTVFLTLENDSQWKGKVRPRGNYVSRVEIPGNFLSDGFFYVDCYLLIVNPSVVEIRERQIIGFEVKDSYDGDSARGEWKETLEELCGLYSIGRPGIQSINI